MLSKLFLILFLSFIFNIILIFNANAVEEPQNDRGIISRFQFYSLVKYYFSSPTSSLFWWPCLWRFSTCRNGMGMVWTTL